MVSTTAFALVAVPAVVVGYLLTSFAYCEVERHRGEDSPLGRVPASTVAALAALVATTAAYFLTQWVVPRELGYVLLAAPQVLEPWWTVALWTAVAAIAGHVAPMWNGFRGGSGLAPAVIVAFAYLPLVLLGALAGWFTGMVVSKRSTVPVRAGLAAAVAVAWFGWIFELGDLWGAGLGPEATFATIVTVGMLLARARIDARRADGTL